MKEIKYYIADKRTPSNEELEECLKLKKQNPNCLICLKWFFPYNGWHQLYFDEDINTIEDCKNNMPKRYGV